jgi:hypothetical protein
LNTTRSARIALPRPPGRANWPGCRSAVDHHDAGDDAAQAGCAQRPAVWNISARRHRSPAAARPTASHGSSPFLAFPHEDAVAGHLHHLARGCRPPRTPRRSPPSTSRRNPCPRAQVGHRALSRQARGLRPLYRIALAGLLAEPRIRRRKGPREGNSRSRTKATREPTKPRPTLRRFFRTRPTADAARRRAAGEQGPGPSARCRKCHHPEAGYKEDLHDQQDRPGGTG